MYDIGSDFQKKIVKILNGLSALKNQKDIEIALSREIDDKLNDLLSNRTFTIKTNSTISQYTSTTDNSFNEVKLYLENQITSLNKRISELEQENKDHNEKNELLKAALLLHVDTEAAEVHNTPKGEVENVFTIEDAMKAQQPDTRQPPVPSPEFPEPLTPTNPDSNINPSSLIRSETKMECNICGNVIKDSITEIFDEPGKKYKCEKCGYIW